MKNQPSFILVPQVYNESCLAEIHLVVVPDNGIKLGVVAVTYTSSHFGGGYRNFLSEAMSVLQQSERRLIIERIENEIADGNIDKGFVFDMPFRVRDTPELKDVAHLFQFVTTDDVGILCREAERVNALLEVLREQYC